MTWFAAGAAAVAAVSSIASAQSAKNSGIKSANSASAAEGAAIVKERLNKTIQNSYSTAFQQMQLGLKKKQLAEQGAQISAAELAAKGDASLVDAATGSIGATTEHVVADIDQKAQAAQDQTQDAFENAVENYNIELQNMVLNTDQSAPTVRQIQYNGPSSGQIIGAGVATGLSSFASSYATRRMSLGPGTTGNVPSQTK